MLLLIPDAQKFSRFRSKDKSENTFIYYICHLPVTLANIENVFISLYCMKRNTRILVERINEVLATEPVNKAWLFGSYSRGEDREDSDIDILVQMAPNDLTILGFLKIQTRLEAATSKHVDFIEDECLEDFARPSVEKDKVLIYEAV